MTQACFLPLYIHRRYTHRVTELLQRRREVQARYDAGEQPNFLPETKHVSDCDKLKCRRWMTSCCCGYACW